jgi:hypothetical protein
VPQKEDELSSLSVINAVVINLDFNSLSSNVLIEHNETDSLVITGMLHKHVLLLICYQAYTFAVFSEGISN